jgi:hypothetical protein
VSDSSIEQQKFQPKLGFIGALIGVAVGLLYGTEWFEAFAPAGIGFVLGGAAPVFARIWPYLFVVVAVLGGATWLIIHYVVT